MSETSEQPRVEAEQAEPNAEIVERFRGILGKAPEYSYHDGSLGVSRYEDKVEVIWRDEKGGDAEVVELDQEGSWDSNYAHSQRREYKADRTDSQIARLVAEKGKPAAIRYSFVELDDWSGQEDRAVNERGSTEFSFDSVEDAVLDSARSQSSDEYRDKSLKEIGKSLLEKDAQERHNKVVAKFRDVLAGTPEYSYHDGSLGVSRAEDEITLVFEDDGQTSQVQLDSAGRWSTNYAHQEPQDYEADPTVVQIAQQVAERGEPVSIIYTRTDIYDWPGSQYENEVVSGRIAFDEVKGNIEHLLHERYPDQKGSSIQAIGKSLAQD